MAPSGKWIDGIGPDSTIEEAARRSLEARLATVNQWLPLAAYLAEHDVEHVHQLRVSTRRATAALRLYRDWLPWKPSRWFRKRLRRIRRAAGVARDLDVLGPRLVLDYGQRRTAAVTALIAERRASFQPDLVKVAERSRRRDRFVRKMAALLSDISAPDAGLNELCFREWSAPQLAEKAGEFFASQPDESAHWSALHRFRILGKALRYTIELVAPAFGQELRNEYYPVAEELQERLGTIQDHFEAACLLRDWSEEAEERACGAIMSELAAEERERLADARREFHIWWTPERSESLRSGLMQAVGEFSSHASRRETVPSQSCGD
jgi:CHAD domain-containing protein